MLAAGKSSLCACQRRVDMQARLLSEARLAPAFFYHDTGSNGTTTARIVLATPTLPTPHSLGPHRLLIGTPVLDGDWTQTRASAGLCPRSGEQIDRLCKGGAPEFLGAQQEAHGLTATMALTPS